MAMSRGEASGGSILLLEPLLGDCRCSALLRSITEEGGFVFVSSMEQAAASGDLRAAEAAREVAWEQLHSGPWHEVIPEWRDAYSMACFYVAAIRRAAGDRREALHALDMGLIMGGNLLRSDLNAAIRNIFALPPQVGGAAEDELDKDSVDRLSSDWNSDQVLRVLPSRSLSCKNIERRSCLPFEEFVADYFVRASPVILSDCIEHWPARTKWKDMNYFKRAVGDRTVPVEVGKNYLSSNWKQELITFSELIVRIRSSECSTEVTYLAQHPLFDQIEELRNDIVIPDYCFAGRGELRPFNAWFGPCGTVTPLHHDPHHNLFAQVIGRKYVRLYPASISKELYPYSESMLSNSSQVDLDSLDVEEFPGVEDIDFVDCILEEGEMLYIPPKWWHYVRSLSTSFSVSFWWVAT